ncbi:hypothetical protein DFH08DRAFT_953035 [Mycena albidolilacea]|uniref:Uncharacterized protein n=1 Tax=Mycena albidolilacea TaxID=1033008 RepID=A0AAD7AJ11_9AGAR|nr:hypothetical protein DFH08DRAFT_953035 [Mycena albidolilacea]
MDFSKPRIFDLFKAIRIGWTTHTFLWHGVFPSGPYSPASGITIRTMKLLQSLLRILHPGFLFTSFFKALCELHLADEVKVSTLGPKFSISPTTYRTKSTRIAGDLTSVHLNFPSKHTIPSRKAIDDWLRGRLNAVFGMILITEPSPNDVDSYGGAAAPAAAQSLAAAVVHSVVMHSP